LASHGHAQDENDGKSFLDSVFYSCADYGCDEYMPSNPCQCDAECVLYKNCCVDFVDVCTKKPPTSRTTTPSALTTTSGTTTTVPCHTAAFGSECYNRVLWVMRTGVVNHPLWYPNLTILSTFEEIQASLHEKHECHCDPPCPVAPDPSVFASQHPKKKSLLSEAASTLAVALVRSSVSEAVCNPAANMALDPADAAKPWRLPKAEVERCFDALVSKKLLKPDSRKYERNWCWVGMKEIGCHWHFYDRITWADMRRLAVAAGGTSNSTFQPVRKPEVCDRKVLGGAIAWTQNEWQAAKQWFSDNVAVYVLSLPTSAVRRATIRARLNELRMPFAFVDGVDLRKPGALRAAKREGLIPEAFNVTLAQAEAYRARQNMGSTGSIVGTVGCAAGHFRAQQHGLTHDPRHLTVVFEDDVSPVDDFIPRLWRLVTKDLPCNWQAVSLYSRCPFGTCVSPHLTRVQPDVNEPAWRCHHGVNYGFQGMVYRTSEINHLQEEWMPVVFDEKRPHCLDVDVALASISDRVQFYAVPASQNPGFLREVSEGSSRVQINFQKRRPPSKAHLADAVPAKRAPDHHHYCGNEQKGDECAKDGRSVGWCSESKANCKACAGSWCKDARHPVQRVDWTA